jgi:hypothetical protein
VAGDDQRGHSFGSVDQSSNQGAILGTFIGFGVLMPFAVERGWRLLFAGYGAVNLVAVLLAWRRPLETNPVGRETAARTARCPIAWSRPWVLLLLVTAVTGAAAGPCHERRRIAGLIKRSKRGMVYELDT